MGERIFVVAMRLLYLLWLNVPLLRPLSDRAMTAVFGRLAPGWDSRIARATRLGPLITALELTGEPKRVLDLGCGTGAGAIEVSRRRPAAWVVGLDVSEEMIARAVANASDAGAAVLFETGLIQNTPFPDGSFDLVTLVNVPPPFREIERLLVRGGHAIVVFTDGPRTPFYSKETRLDRGFRRARLSRLSAASDGDGEYFVAVKR